MSKHFESDLDKQLISIRRHFNPDEPIRDIDMLTARKELVERLSAEVASARPRLLCLQGSRGVGKTSIIASLDTSIAADDRALSIRLNCSVNDTFSSILRRALPELSRKTTSNLFIPARLRQKISPDEVRTIVERLPQNLTLVLLIDDVDAIEDHRETTLLAHLSKIFADRHLPVTVILTETARAGSSARGLPSHCYRLIPMMVPPLSLRELQEVIKNREQKISMRLSDAARDKVIDWSEGTLRRLHLLARHSLEHAARTHRYTASVREVEKALQTIAAPFC